jgi:hypothetical protein
LELHEGKNSTIGTKNISTSIAMAGSSNSVRSRGAFAAAGVPVHGDAILPVMARPAGPDFIPHPLKPRYVTLLYVLGGQFRKGRSYGAFAPVEVALRKPITGIAFCWARKGYAAVNAPPSSSINSRLLIQ